MCLGTLHALLLSGNRCCLPQTRARIQPAYTVFHEQTCSLEFCRHFDFLNRYRHLPEAQFGDASRAHPLILTRSDILDSFSLVERLLCNESEAAHAAIADALWEAASDDDAMSALESLARENLAAWEAEVRGGPGGGSDRETQG